MADLTRQDISQVGIAPTYAAADVAGDAFVNDDRTFFAVKNGDASDHTATIAVQNAILNSGNLGNVNFAAIAVLVPAGEERWVKAPMPAYNDGNGKVQVSYDAVTSVTVAAVRVPAA